MVDMEEKNKYHLVVRNIVCRLEECDRMRIRPPCQLYEALLGKCLWRIVNSLEGLWKHTLVSKYEIENNCWETKEVGPRDCTMV